MSVLQILSVFLPDNQVMEVRISIAISSCLQIIFVYTNFIFILLSDKYLIIRYVIKLCFQTYKNYRFFSVKYLVLPIIVCTFASVMNKESK